MNQDIRKITDGAMMCAIIGVLLLVDRQLAGVLSGYLLFIIPLPMVFYATRYGWKTSWMVLVAMGLLSIMISTPETIFYVISESFLGMLYGTGVHDHWEQHRLVVFCMILGAVISVVSTVVLASVFGYDLGAEVTEMSSMFEGVVKETGMSMPSTLDLPSLFRNMIVISAILTGVLQGLVTHLLSRLLFKRLHMHIEPAKPIQLYFPAKWTGYAGLLGLVAYYYSIYRPFSNSLVQNVSQSLGICGFFYLVIMGAIAILVTVTLTNPKGRGIAILLSMLAVFVFLLPCAIFGFLYITTDMHKKMIGGITNAKQAG